MKHFLQSCTLTALAVFANPAIAQQTTFERVFTQPGTFDAEMIEKVKALPAGEHLPVDTNGDGRHDEVWFIDNDPRHSAARRPILVRVLDEDGDLHESGPDHDSDLYLADWQADGTVDAVVDYQDEDADGDLDQMGIYFGDYQKPWTDKNKIKVWWSNDLGDDDQLWYHVDYAYDQAICQHRCHFSGDEVFYQFSLEGDASQWQNLYVNPFAFYDPDLDTCSEEVLRLEAEGTQITSLRYSFDIDNDAHGRNTHDYEFSITALPETNTLQSGTDNTQPLEIRGIPTVPILNWQTARNFALQAPWTQACLTWDEINANTEEQFNRDPHQRWEGVINRKSENFPQVGGPPSSALNKRYEISLKPSQPLKLYYDTTDHRLHLLGASSGWIDIDANFDGTVDARYVYLDQNNDGIFDRRQLDLDADGTVDFDWPMQVKDIQRFDLQWQPLTEFYVASLNETLADSQSFIDAARSVLIDEHKHQDPAALFFTNELANWLPATRLGQHVRKTPGGARLYLDLARDRIFLALQKQFGETEKWRKIAGAYQAGAYKAAAANIKGLGISQSTRTAASYKTYTRRLPLHFDNRKQPQRDAWPATFNLSEIRSLAPEFTPEQCALVAPQRHIEWRQIPHQIDQVEESAGGQLSFLVDLPANGVATYYLYYAPSANQVTNFSSQTAAAENWLPENLSWESNLAAYSIHNGQINLLGKSGESLLLSKPAQLTNATTIGNLSLYQDEQHWPIHNSEGVNNIQFNQRVITQGPVRSAVEFVASNIIPDRPEISVQTVCLIYADRPETEIRTTVTGTDSEIILAPTLAKVANEKASSDTETGVFSSWGKQSNTVGEVGVGLITSPESIIDVREEPTERRIRSRISKRRKMRHWLIGNRRRQRRYPVAPSHNNWQQELNQLATQLLNEVPKKIGDPEILP